MAQCSLIVQNCNQNTFQAFTHRTRSFHCSLVSRFVRMMGHTPQLPQWIREGTILGLQGGTERVLAIINQALDAGVRVNGVWIQDWPGHIFTSFGKRVFWNWQWNQTHYPGNDIYKGLGFVFFSEHLFLRRLENRNETYINSSYRSTRSV